MTKFRFLQAYLEFFSRSLRMECKNTNIMIQTVTPGLIKADENPNENALTYVLPNMNNFVRNTVDSLGVSSRITGSWFFSMEVLNIVFAFIGTTLFKREI